MTLKGCALFILSFFIGIALVISGFVYDVVVVQNLEMDRQSLPARILELSGVIVAFGSIFAASAFAFYHRGKAPAVDTPDAKRNH